MVKNPPANAGNVRDAGSTPGSGRSPGEGHATHSSILFFFFFTPVFLTGETHGERNLTCCSPWGRTELDTTEVALHTCMLGFAQYRCSIRALCVKA